MHKLHFNHYLDAKAAREAQVRPTEWIIVPAGPRDAGLGSLVLQFIGRTNGS